MNIQEVINSLDFSSLAWQVFTPIIFSVVDILTGFIQALINNSVSSKVMRVGLLHKILIIIVVLLYYFSAIFKIDNNIITDAKFLFNSHIYPLPLLYFIDFWG